MIKTIAEELEIIHKDVGVRVSGYYSMPEIQNRKIDELVAAHNELEKRVDEFLDPFKPLGEKAIEPKFKVGDKVRVVRKVGDWAQNSWVSDMDKYIGKTGIVVQVSDGSGVRVEIDNDYWEYSPNSLEKVK